MISCVLQSHGRTSPYDAESRQYPKNKGASYNSDTEKQMIDHLQKQIKDLEDLNKVHGCFDFMIKCPLI